MKKEGLLETLKHTLPWIIGIVTGVAFFAAAAVVTVLIPNHFYKRMTPIYWYDYVILAMISALLGLYMGRALFMRGRKAKCDYAAGGGMVGGFFAVSCSLCSAILVALFGATALLTDFEPLQPALGLASIGLLGYANYGIWKKIPSKH